MSQRNIRIGSLRAHVNDLIGWDTSNYDIPYLVLPLHDDYRKFRRVVNKHIKVLRRIGGSIEQARAMGEREFRYIALKKRIENYSTVNVKHPCLFTSSHIQTSPNFIPTQLDSL